MQCWAYLLQAVSLSVFLQGVAAQNLILTNDDGWATAQVRAQRDALVDTGFDVGRYSSVYRR